MLCSSTKRGGKKHINVFFTSLSRLIILTLLINIKYVHCTKYVLVCYVSWSSYKPEISVSLMVKKSVWSSTLLLISKLKRGRKQQRPQTLHNNRCWSYWSEVAVVSHGDTVVILDLFPQSRYSATVQGYIYIQYIYIPTATDLGTTRSYDVA